MMVRKKIPSTFAVLGLMAAVQISGNNLKHVLAAECKKPNFSTTTRQFMSEGGIGRVGFAFTRSPVAIELVTAGNCYKIPKHFRKKRLFIFLNHRSNHTENRITYLTAQIVKKFKILRFDQDKVTAMRQGLWQRTNNNSHSSLPEIPEMKAFDGMSTEGFGKLHKRVPFSEKQLVEAFNGQFWHGTPVGGDVSTLDRLSYWNSLYTDDRATKLENFLVRFTTVKFGEEPEAHKKGIPINTYFHSDLSTLKVSVRSPADGGIQTSFTLE